MKRSILFAAVSVAMLGLSGCAVPVEIKQSQALELDALRTYHKAERAEYRAKVGAEISSGAKIAAEARRMAAEYEKQQALADLHKSLNSKV